MRALAPRSSCYLSVLFSAAFALLELLNRSLPMGRAPCCDKKGLKKGPWTPEEDKLLVDFIQANGHGSWRLLPKLAGLFFSIRSINPTMKLTLVYLARLF